MEIMIIMVFGYLMLISILRFLYSYFSIFLLLLVPVEKINVYRTLKIVTFPDISKFIRNTPLWVVFSTTFVLLNEVKQSILCLLYNINTNWCYRYLQCMLESYPRFFFPLPFPPLLTGGAGSCGGAMDADNAIASCVSSSKSLR